MSHPARPSAHLVRRIVPLVLLAAASTDAERARAVADAERATRSTSIHLDPVSGEARAVNQGGGEPSQGVVGLVREFETAEELGRPGTRALRVAALCAGTQ